jgi:hypothetical protein
MGRHMGQERSKGIQTGLLATVPRTESSQATQFIQMTVIAVRVTYEPELAGKIKEQNVPSSATTRMRLLYLASVSRRSECRTAVYPSFKILLTVLSITAHRSSVCESDHSARAVHQISREPPLVRD